MVRARASRRSASAPRRHPSQQDLLTGPRWPLFQNLLSLTRVRAQLAKAVHGDVQSQEIFQHGREQVHSAAHELFLVELHLHLSAARKRHAIARYDAREMPAAGEPYQSL